MNKRLGFFAALLLLSTVSFAASKVLTPSLSLAGMSKQQASERGGDELYLTVTTYPSQGKPSHTEIPAFPHYWLSGHVDQVKNVPLWTDKLSEGESATIVLSMIERDSPPWDVDDLIGTVQLIVKNKNGVLQTSWKMPNRTDTDKITEKKDKSKVFVFTDNGNYKYTVRFSLVSK